MNFKTLVIACCASLASAHAQVSFLAVDGTLDNAPVLKQEGDLDTPYPPESSFKAALAVMGYDAGILIDEDTPEWPCLETYDTYVNVCKGAHTPRTWMRDSCLWYSRVLTPQLGMERFQEYVNDFDYGNRDLSGDKEKNNGLTQAWVSSSLKISPRQQVRFLQKLASGELPVTALSMTKTKRIMFIQEMAGGWKLYGKTGNGTQFDASGRKTDLQHGWFVGWIEKGKRKIIFAAHIVDSIPQETFSSFRIRNEALIKLWYLINELEA